MLSFTFFGLRADGSQLTKMRKNLNEKPEFYALLVNGQVFDYYTSFEALAIAVERIKVDAPENVFHLNEADATSFPSYEVQVTEVTAPTKVTELVWVIDEENETIESTYETAEIKLSA